MVITVVLMMKIMMPLMLFSSLSLVINGTIIIGNNDDNQIIPNR